MVLRLDPRYPILWRSPTSLQLGADDPPVILAAVSTAEERMLAALVIGVSRPGLDLIARTSGEAVTAAARLLRAVAPALAVDGAPPTHAVSLVGVGATVDLLADALRLEGVSVATCGRDLARAAQAMELVVLVTHFVIEPELHGLWLRRDIPHLPVVLGDGLVTIGPLVEPGSGPCLYCVERTRTDAEPHWPAVESQLWGRSSPLDRGLVAAESAAIAARAVLARLALGRSGGPSTSLRLDAATGVTTRREHSPHPDCACSALSGTATADAEPIAEAVPRRRTAAVDAVLA